MIKMKVLLSLIFLLKLTYSFGADNSCIDGQEIWGLVRASPNAGALEAYYRDDTSKDPNEAHENLKKLAEEFRQTLNALSDNVLRLRESDTTPYRPQLELEKQAQTQSNTLVLIILEALLQVYRVERGISEKKIGRLYQIIGGVGAFPALICIGLAGETAQLEPTLIGLGITGVTAILTYTTYRLQKFFKPRKASRTARALWEEFVTQSGLNQLAREKSLKPLAGAKAAFCQLTLMSSDPNQTKQLLPHTDPSD